MAENTVWCAPRKEKSKGYLIKWKGYSKWHCTLEPKRHLNEACLQEIKHPSKPLPRRLEATSEEVLYTVQKKLSNCHHSSGLVKVNVDLDIFRWILNGKGKRLEKAMVKAGAFRNVFRARAGPPAPTPCAQVQSSPAAVE
ncbi:hypothetical protein HPB51_024365 [Rhipicephalus microplus]|uniref:Chromo domain-containing protein n=1 Tax=Rhipicephalus microplus TaxID=6941 RepID=A0A9J6D8A3_RHIMP|nr:hypothetical protein HPB51_024365 [Rhipicephalus microplus]